ncbi:MAG TPA: carboxymuconolactone decarboxylase family protein [Novosphingobium sp.]|nr:carboxymuconolactone decarboxylase family protein [Novosphingobium sp.]HZV10424.1 carboxymuconolactone decarboxylase family protein [Novosphingobium sp.]
MSRISKIDHTDWDPELRAITHADEASVLERGTLRIMAHKPETAKGFVRFFAALKAERSLPERLLELVRLRIAYHNQCRSCMAIRYAGPAAAGVDEALVCTLERPMEADDLTPAEKLAIDYGERLATNHLSLDDAFHDRLRAHFTEAQIVELGMFCAVCVGFGRLGASWDMVEELPQAFRQRDGGPIAPWQQAEVIPVR